jgi:hypothetical protein
LKQDNFDKYFDQIITQYDSKLAFFDSNKFIETISNPTDQKNNAWTLRKKDIIPVAGLQEGFINRLIIDLCKSISQMENRLRELSTNKINPTHQYSLTVTLEGTNLYGEKVKYQSGSFDIKAIVELYLGAAVSQD